MIHDLHTTCHSSDSVQIYLEGVFSQTHYEGIAVCVQNTMLNHRCLCKVDLSDFMNSFCERFDVFPVYLKRFFFLYNIRFRFDSISFSFEIDLREGDLIFWCKSSNKDGLWTARCLASVISSLISFTHYLSILSMILSRFVYNYYIGPFVFLLHDVLLWIEKPWPSSRIQRIAFTLV